jgi:hypothetical protein
MGVVVVWLGGDKKDAEEFSHFLFLLDKTVFPKFGWVCPMIRRKHWLVR